MVAGEPLRRGASKAARSTPARSSAVMAAPFGHQLTHMRTRPLRRMTTRRASSFSTLESGAGDTEIAAASGAIARMATAFRRVLSVLTFWVWFWDNSPSCLFGGRDLALAAG